MHPFLCGAREMSVLRVVAVDSFPPAVCTVVSLRRFARVPPSCRCRSSGANGTTCNAGSASSKSNAQPLASIRSRTKRQHGMDRRFPIPKCIFVLSKHIGHWQALFLTSCRRALRRKKAAIEQRERHLKERHRVAYLYKAHTSVHRN